MNNKSKNTKKNYNFINKVISNLKNNLKPSCLFLLILSSLLFTLNVQFRTTFKTTSIERLLYNIINMETLSGAVSSLSYIAKKSVSIFFIILFLSLVPSFFKFNKKIKINWFSKKEKRFVISFKCWPIFLVVLSLIFLLENLNFLGFVSNNISYSNFYEDNYVEYSIDLVKFPKKKRNLITIYVESFETSVFNKKNGGTLNKNSYMPNIEALTSEYINFSHNNKFGGFHQFNGADWTAAGLISQTAGIPIYIKTKNSNNKFLDGAVSIGEILNDNGYKNYFLMGSDATFGERKKYFLEHGNYNIMDYVKAKEEGFISNNYYEWWGLEDEKLYTWAKNKLLEISLNDEPFNFSMLTADTHFYEGYVSSNCPNKFNDSYANSYYCTDIMLSNFITWIQQQKFYDNTTIVIVGDHITMRDDFFDFPKNYERTGFNLFINSAVETNNNKNRKFSSFDIFPTTLASLGVTIDGDRLAIGTNLFSDKKTLTEELGFKKYKKELGKKSKYYKDKILKN